MNVHQFLTSFSYGDAIGNEAIEIRDVLRKHGFQSEIFSQSFHPKYANEVKNYLIYDAYSAPDNIVIFHFSIASPVTKRYLRLPDRKFMIYHNITPFQYFLDSHRGLAKECFKGRIELKNLADKVELALGDSEFNRQELVAAGYPNTGVLPLVINFDKFEREPLPVFRRLFADGKTNIIFVGRIISHKKIEDVIKTFHLYQHHFNPDSRLFIVGEFRGFERYFHSLLDLVNRLKTRHVHFTGHTPHDELVSYFKLSHLYLHMSEHEGFCAPVIESFHLQIPVFAFCAGAVPETMNNGGILFSRKDFMAIATLMNEVIRDSQLRNVILASQQTALRKYTRQETGRILLEYLKKQA